MPEAHLQDNLKSWAEDHCHRAAARCPGLKFWLSPLTWRKGKFCLAASRSD
jgi:hypothetical protein